MAQIKPEFDSNGFFRPMLETKTLEDVRLKVSAWEQKKESKCFLNWWIHTHFTVWIWNKHTGASIKQTFKKSCVVSILMTQNISERLFISVTEKKPGKIHICLANKISVMCWCYINDKHPHIYIHRHTQKKENIKTNNLPFTNMGSKWTPAP